MNVPAGISTNSMPMLLVNVGSNAVGGAGERVIAEVSCGGVPEEAVDGSAACARGDGVALSTVSNAVIKRSTSG